MAKTQDRAPLGIADAPKFNDRRIYNTIAADAETQIHIPGYAVRPNVRKAAAKRKIKTTNVVGVMILAAVAALMYVGNVVAVNSLAKEVNDLRTQYNQIISYNEVLKAEINRKSSLDRIGLLAQEQLGMTNPKDAPVWFDVNKEKEAELLRK